MLAKPSACARSLGGFTDYLGSRRKAILQAWMDQVERNLGMTTVDAPT